MLRVITIPGIMTLIFRFYKVNIIIVSECLGVDIADAGPFAKLDRLIPGVTYFSQGTECLMQTFYRELMTYDG